MDKINRNKYLQAGIALIVIVAALYFLFIFEKKPKDISFEGSAEEVKLLSDVDLKSWPFVTLTPTSDGAEIIISIENMNYFESIEYELTYLADNPQVTGEKIQRGATGTDVNTKEEKYKKSILLGTASRGVRSPDKGIEGGALVMHMFKDTTEFRSETPWTFLEAGSTETEISHLNDKFKINVPSLGKNYWIILAETLGVPPQKKPFDVSDVVLPIYGSFSVAPKLPKETSFFITIEADIDSPEVYSFSVADSAWQKLDPSYNSQTKTATVKTNAFTTFVVISSK